MHAAKQMFYLNKEARQTCTMHTSGTWLKEVGPSRCMTCATTTACCCCTCIYLGIITKLQDLSMHQVNDEPNSNATLLAGFALCTLYACQRMTLPGTESQAQLSAQGLSPQLFMRMDVH